MADRQQRGRHEHHRRAAKEVVHALGRLFARHELQHGIVTLELLRDSQRVRINNADIMQDDGPVHRRVRRGDECIKFLPGHERVGR